MKELEIFLIKVKDIIAYTYSVEYNKQVRPYFPARKYPFEYKMLEYILKYTKNIYLGNIKRDTLEKELKQISMTPIGQKMINSLTFYSHKRGSSFDNKICKYTMFRLKIIASNLSEDSYKDAYRIKKKLFCMTESDRGLYAVLFAKNLDVYLNKIFMDILNLENLGWSSFYLKEDVSKFVQNVFDYFALFNIDLFPVISKGCELDMRHFDYIRFRNNKFIIQTIGAGNCTWVLGNNEKKVCILNILHDLIGDGKASHASKILKAAIKAGVITKPTYTQIKKEFPNIGGKIKRFWGTTENAVRIQIYAAICTYCLVAIIQHDMQLDRSTYEVLQILSISLTDKTHLRDLFDKTKFQNDKERFGPNGPSLFNF